MKKVYQQPATMATVMEPRAILCASGQFISTGSAVSNVYGS